MSAECEKLQRFADGELESSEAAAFRGHLARCPACQAGLLEHMQLDTLLQEAALHPASLSRRRLRPRWHRRSVPLAMAASVLALLALGLWWRHERLGPSEGPILLALSPGRSIEPRLTHPGAAAWRPYTVRRTAEASGAEQVPLGTLAELERRGDFHGLATAYLLGGERARAVRALEQAGSSADADCDRAVLALEHGELNEALLLLDGVLAKVPAHPQALWNRALALQRLGLTLSAAESFSSVAALAEPGWGEEARQRAEELRHGAEARRASWRELFQRGMDMVKGGAPLPLELARRRPGLSRLLFYDAVRASSSRAQVEALRPLAAELDRSASGPVLERYVQRVANSDLGRRRGLAEEYARLASGQLPLDEAGARALLARLRSAGLEDLELGALLHTHQVGTQLERYQVLAARSADPWFELIAAHEQARALLQRGELLRAEGQLVAAVGRCQGARLDYRCALLEVELSGLYTQLNQLEKARVHAQQAARLAQAAEEWILEVQSLLQLAEVARLEGAFPLARAYLQEVLRREPDDCRYHSYVRDTFAGIALLQMDAAGAAREYAQPQTCELPPSVHKAMVLAELVRLNGGAQLEKELSGALAALRASSGTSPGERAMLDHLEARALLERERDAGRALLRRSIEAADRLPRWDVNARKARAHSYVLLAVDAARAGEADAALGAIAAGLEVAEPARCALGVAVDDERLVQVARNAQGASVVVFATRAAGELQVDSLVTEPLRRQLADCETVQVLAMPPVQGKPRLLPADMAWSYQLPGGAAARAAGLPERRVVVSSVEAPASLGLPPLGRWRTSGEPPQVELTGAAATPSRVLAELPEATLIEFHVHGLVDLELAGASSLVLAQEPDGHFTLEAQVIRQQRLRGAPLVILGACHAARTLPWMHQAWSLPAAFLEGGAAAVLASPGVVQDAEAPAFFRAVEERIRAGAKPAVALREERVRWLARDGLSWVRDVMLFE